MEQVGGVGKFKREWYKRVPQQTEDETPAKKYFYLRAYTQRGYLYLNNNCKLSVGAEARVFKPEEEETAYQLAQHLNAKQCRYKFEVFSVGSPINF